MLLAVSKTLNTRYAGEKSRESTAHIFDCIRSIDLVSHLGHQIF
jgi:hypothetical protein